LHIHVPDGSTPKDGPSAGVTLASAIMSIILQIPVMSSVAMTGELTLKGKVMPIGGLKEKIIAANRELITEFIIPYANIKD